MTSRPRTDVLIIGAGPAGLTAAHALMQRGRRVTVLEKDDQVGGLARTVTYKGFRFDIGGHRFFTRVEGLRDLWRSMLGADFLTRPRLSRIFYDGHYFSYPLRPLNALRGLGLVNAVRVAGSYLHSRLRPIEHVVSFEDWVVNRFGRRLFDVFFRTYTEKVWGMPCSEIGAQWAAQRIQSLSLWTAVTDMLFRRFRRPGSAPVKSLIEQFEYPRLGPGMMWEAFQARIEEGGQEVVLGANVTGITHRDGTVEAVSYEQGGRTVTERVDAVLSTMPLRELVESLSPAPPVDVRAAAARLQYRAFLTVALIVEQPEVFEDNWIYVHDPGVKLGRIQNFKNWSPDMVPDRRRTCLGLEYFCAEGDDLWRMTDDELIALGRRELVALGLAKADAISDGSVVRMPHAYPVYSTDYHEAVAVIRDYLAGFTNLQVAGRNGMHKYNNQDHSMVTAMLAAENLMGGSADPWGVNADDEYHESDQHPVKELVKSLDTLAPTQPLVPMPVGSSESTQAR
ncbi:MAG: NAD(P)/FAD-dependent oxidoreductase [Vicinamibacterales bacterium]